MVQFINMPGYQPSPLLDLSPLAQGLQMRQKAQQAEAQRLMKEREFAEGQRQFNLGNERGNKQLELSQNADRRQAEMAPLDQQAKKAQIAQTQAAVAQMRNQTPEARLAMAPKFGIDPATPEGKAFVLNGTFTPKTDSIVTLDPEKVNMIRPANGGPMTPIDLPNGGQPSVKDLQREAEIRKEFIGQQGVKEFQTVRQSYQNVKAAAKDPSAAGDLSMIFAYMKILDPNSVVREQEFANAQNAAGVPDRVQNVYNRLIRGERLNPAQRQDFINQADKIYASQNRQYESIKKQYKTLAEKSRARPDAVTMDYGIVDDPTPLAEGGAGRFSQTQAAPPQGASGPRRVRNAQGVELEERNGQWVRVK